LLRTTTFWALADCAGDSRRKNLGGYAVNARWLLMGSYVNDF
jgi:hypothetical protein